MFVTLFLTRIEASGTVVENREENNMLVRNKVFLVTGGGSGLGAAVSRLLAAEGARVVIADVNVDAGKAVEKGLGDAARFVRTDVTSEEDAATAMATAVEAFGHLHGLVNCAGIAPGEKVVGRDGPHRLESFIRALLLQP
jgi:NAD(P)-dependent dehydrogenase (short-subunit alcohol dehydrogenase family)